MKIQVIKNIQMAGAPTVKILPGSLVELPEETAKQWIASGYAQPVIETTESPRQNMEKAILPAPVKRNQRSTSTKR